MKLPGRKPQQPVGRQRRTPVERPVLPTAYSYHANRSERSENESRQKSSLVDRRSRVLTMEFWAKRSTTLVAGLIVIVALVLVVSLSTKPKIVLLSDGGGDQAFHSSETYQAAAAKYLSGSVWNHNKVTVDTGAVGTALEAQFPELSGVSVSLPFIGRQPTLYLHAHTPAFILQAVNGTYVLDSSGKALLTKDAAAPSAIAKLPVLSDQSGMRVTLGKPTISAAEASFIQTVLSILQAKHISVSSLALPAGAAQELDVHISGQSYYVKFNMHDTTSARQQVGTYIATVNNLAGQSMPTQYIDVRVLGRAYYL